MEQNKVIKTWTPNWKHDQNIGTKKLIYIYKTNSLTKIQKRQNTKQTNKYERVITFCHFKLYPKLHFAP